MMMTDSSMDFGKFQDLAAQMNAEHTTRTKLDLALAGEEKSS